ncbi:hypothetical protein [Absidia glauca]|uniref:C2H2-type domain-containing protein n=1 Tax=Absidia glauca TaxID=4829 RepID=A0A168PEF1_ABSGL|nr:hypothetical protein [Absidia glauca]
MSSSCIQTFQDPLVHEPQSNVLRFVNPNSLDQAHATDNAYYLTSPTSKQKESQQCQQTPRRFSYADLLSGQAPSSYDSDPYYLPLTSSSPSNASDDYQHPHSHGSDSSASSTHDQLKFMDANTSNPTSGPFMMNDVHFHPASGSSTPHPAALASPATHVSGDGLAASASASINMALTDSASATSAPMSFNLTCSPTPSVVEPHFLQQQQQHRHSIATAHHLGNHSVGSSFYDNTIHRHHSFSHHVMHEQPKNQQPHHSHHHHHDYYQSSPSGMMQGYSTLGQQHPVRPMTPVSPHTKDMHQHPTSNDHMQQHSQGLINDLCLSIPPTSMYNMSPQPNSASLHYTHRDISNRHRQSHVNKQLPQDDKGNNNTNNNAGASIKKTPRSRGRRVSNIPSNGTRMFICKDEGCGKVFKRSEHLKRHIRSIHTLEKPFECPYQSCNKRFSRSDNLNQHIRIHRHTNGGPTKLDKQHQKQQANASSPPTNRQSSENQHFASYVQDFI